MKNVFCRFYRTEEVNTTAWDNIVGKLQLDFKLLCEGKIEAHSAAQYASQLCRNAMPLSNNPRMSFLGMDDPNTMPGDARVEYVYMPTYYATAFIAKAALLDPELLYGSPWYDSELERDELRAIFSACLLGCTGRGFKGHGFDDISGLVDTMEIFADADMNTFIAKYPELCPEFTETYKAALAFIERCVSNGKLAGAWGDDYTERGKVILEKNGILQA